MQEVPELTPEMLQANPALMVAVLLLIVVSFGTFVCSLSAWIFLIYRRLNHQSILTTAPWAPRAWGLLDLVLIGICVVVVQNLAVVIAAKALGIEFANEEGKKPTIPLNLIAIVGVANLVVMLGGIAWISLRYKTSPAHSGFTLTKTRRNLAIGLIGGFASLPVVYTLMIVVNTLFGKEYDHPLISEMTKNATVASYLMGAFAAVIVAPLTEEFLFRVLLQGWLQSIPFRSIHTNLIGGFASSRGIVHETDSDVSTVAPQQPIADSALSERMELSLSTSDPFRPPQIASQNFEEQTVALEGEYSPPVWPAVVSGVLFGLAHYEYGLSFVPLIVLGIILGLMYRATHSIWPSLCVHFMLNSISMFMLGFVLLLSNAASNTADSATAVQASTTDDTSIVDRATESEMSETDTQLLAPVDTIPNK